ncbi:hypothetical protein FJT64_019111 [Amphibalanus amphitrite]|uniref:RNase H type-1 domain-containing protein n=1 Tax=Amphibalanus amphitrite TaxID=1232801 RepID=A0A6A4WQR0_AMPAM|nr:hypothetical protein FJT64_019111 [Amphibalanus amphitrite]
MFHDRWEELENPEDLEEDPEELEEDLEEDQEELEDPPKKKELEEDPEDLLAEADLPALTVRAKELAATEASRIARLPAEDRAKQLLERDPRPRLKYRAHEAWKRACAQAAEEGRPEPALPDEDALLPHKPCLRRVGQWREAAERALAALPAPDCSIWSDGSAAGGTSNGGGGAAIILHRENDRRIECLAAAGTHCSSTRAELVAVREALKSLASLPADSLDAIKEIRLCTDSRACLQTLQRGQAAQQKEKKDPEELEEDPEDVAWGIV